MSIKETYDYKELMRGYNEPALLKLAVQILAEIEDKLEKAEQRRLQVEQNSRIVNEMFRNWDQEGLPPQREIV